MHVFLFSFHPTTPKLKFQGQSQTECLREGFKNTNVSTIIATELLVPEDNTEP